MEDTIILFLDIDGVLATDRQFFTKKLHPKYNIYGYDQRCVKILNEIIDETGAQIVLSSDWKTHFTLAEMNEIFRDNSIKHTIIDFTPNLWGTEYFKYQNLEDCRANEILRYVQEHDIKTYVAVDDLYLKNWIPINFVQCTQVREGIKQSGVKNKIIKILTEKA